jgi:diguanylate cyclase (GGDEF)-like protein
MAPGEVESLVTGASDAGYRALHDPITGLANGVLFAERVDHLLRTSAPDARLGLCFLELDSISDDERCGHPVPDPLLVAVAERLDHGLTRAGRLLARLGRTEFVILVTGPGLIPGAVVEVAGQVLQLLAAPFRVGEHEMRVLASIGVVERTVADTSRADLLHAADLGMRRARTGDRAHWIAVDLDRARAVVRTR